MTNIETVVEAWSTDEFDDKLLDWMDRDSGFDGQSLEPDGTYIDDLSFDEVVEKELDEEENAIIAQIAISYSDNQITGCSNIELTKPGSATIKITIPLDFPEDHEIECIDWNVGDWDIR